MYGYSEYIPLTVEEITKRVSQEDIFKAVMNNDIIVDKGVKYLAPYRNDTHPDCYFEYFNGRLCFVDFADVFKRPKDCFEVISRTKGISYTKAMEYVNNYFKLGLGDSTGEVKEVIEGSVIIEDLSKEIKKNRTITYLPRKFNYKDSKYWDQYEISSDNLIEDKVVAIDLYRAYSRRGDPFVIRPFDIAYAYTGFDEGRVKIYRPYGNKDEKWFTNCTQDDIGCIDSLPLTGEQLIISKSYKDCRVIRNQGLNSVWFQNEGMIPNQTILRSLCKRFKKIYVWFDNDQAGLANGKFVTDYINSLEPSKATFIFLPPRLLREYTIKDPSDHIARHGRQDLVEFMQSKNLFI